MGEGRTSYFLVAMTAQDMHGFLNPNDPVAISFWIISISMVAATVFFLMESTAVATEWKTSLNVGSLVTLVAAVHYFYMREFWITIGTSPILYRYIDWSITVPLQMVEFYFILTAAKADIGAGMFFRLFLGTVAMLAAGYSGEAGNESRVLGGHVKKAFDIMKFIVTIGWSIYPLGYYFGYLLSGVDDSTLNLVYNFADFVNKIAFCLAIWNCAKQDTQHKINGGVGEAFLA